MGTQKQILYHLVRALPNKQIPEENLQNEKRNLDRLNRLLKAIDEGYSLGVSLKDLAAREKLDMLYLSQLFNKMAISFRDYLMRRRVERAVELLLQDRVTLTEICMEAGFSDGRYLNRTFQQIHGCTPAAYRRQYAGLAVVQPARTDCSQDRYYEPSEVVKAIGRYVAPAQRCRTADIDTRKGNVMANKPIRYGMVGGDLGAFIGKVHRIALGFEPSMKLADACFSKNMDNNLRTGETFEMWKISGMFAQSCHYF